jgi:hypothetical protein
MNNDKIIHINPLDFYTLVKDPAWITETGKTISKYVPGTDTAPGYNIELEIMKIGSQHYVLDITVPVQNEQMKAELKKQQIITHLEQLLTELKALISASIATSK